MPGLLARRCCSRNSRHTTRSLVVSAYARILHALRVALAQFLYKLTHTHMQRESQRANALPKRPRDRDVSGELYVRFVCVWSVVMMMLFQSIAAQAAARKTSHAYATTRIRIGTLFAQKHTHSHEFAKHARTHAVSPGALTLTRRARSLCAQH